MRVLAKQRALGNNEFTRLDLLVTFGIAPKVTKKSSFKNSLCSNSLKLAAHSNISVIDFLKNHKISYV